MASTVNFLVFSNLTTDCIEKNKYLKRGKWDDPLPCSTCNMSPKADRDVAYDVILK